MITPAPQVRTERFDFPGAAGQTLSGALDLPAGEARAHALIAHCFSCTKSSLAAVHIARALAAAGVAVLRFDFTGLGLSEGEFANSTFSGNVEDLVAATRAMESAGRPVRLVIGHSLGGAAALAAAARVGTARAVVTVGAPYDVAHVARLFGDRLETLLREGEAEVDLGGRPFRMRRSFIDDLASHDQEGRIRDLNRALLVMHSPRDAVVGIENAAAIFQAAHHPKSFVSLDDADHLLTRQADAQYAAEVIAAWASRYVAA